MDFEIINLNIKFYLLDLQEDKQNIFITLETFNSQNWEMTQNEKIF